MPTYEYRCRACGHGFDIVQSFKDESLTICPACGGELRKVFSAPSISFKGSGFYATDSRKGSTGSTETRRDGAKDGAKQDGSKEGSKEGSSTKEAASSDGSSGGSSKDPGSSSSDGASASKPKERSSEGASSKQEKKE